MRDIAIWITYHDNAQIESYHLQENDIFHLYNANDLMRHDCNINYLNHFYSEIVTMYWAWKNNIQSEKIGFCHYRRRFNKLIEIKQEECQVLEINHHCPVFEHYKVNHNYHDLYDMIDILNEQYGIDNKYSQYLLTSRTFIPYCSFIMHWGDFIHLCEFLFPVLEAYDKKNGLHMNPQQYMRKAKKDFRYDDVQYQRRATAFLAERLISCYIVCELKPYSLISL